MIPVVGAAELMLMFVRRSARLLFQVPNCFDSDGDSELQSSTAVALLQNTLRMCTVFFVRWRMR